jgi:succinate dehydrogenase / fumarate reductase, cytochrome b subunit
VKDKRPVNLDIGSMQLPLTAWASIGHRASGAILIVGVGVLLWFLQQSLASPEGFESARDVFQSGFAKLVLWGVAAALIYHSCAGVKHLIMDMGVGETMEGGVLGSKIVFATSAVLIILAGIWIW